MPTPSANIYIDLGLSLEPATTDPEELRAKLETKIKHWNKSGNRFQDTIKKVKRYIDAGFGDLQQQSKEAYNNKMGELRKQVSLVKKMNVVEEQTEKIINNFKMYFSEATILHEITGHAQESGFPPKQPETLKECKKQISYSDMKEIVKDLGLIGKRTLYELLGNGVSKDTKLDKLQEAVEKAKYDIRTMQKGTYEADIYNRLERGFSHFEDAETKKSYDYALKRYPFDKLCEDELNFYAQGFLKQQKTDWKIYQEAIRIAKSLGEYNQAEADYLVYEYFVLVKKCPAPVPPEKEPPPPGTIFGSQRLPEEMTDEVRFGTYLDDVLGGVFGKH